MEVDELKSELLTAINDRQELTYNELSEIASSHNVGDDLLKRSLKELEKVNAIASRNSGGIPTYYILQEQASLSRIMIVEDDKNINKLMALSVGKEFDITQIYDGREAIQRIRSEKPDLVILDLMLPGVDGLDICQTVKRDPSIKDTVIIIVSAMDATSNRFKGIKLGADYYIKKPFDPDELRSLVKIFLRKKGKRFDPLIDLPNEERISKAVEKALQTSGSYEIGKLRLAGLAEFARSFGNNSGITILRLISQLMQDKVRELNRSKPTNIFVGFLDNEDFVVAGDSASLSKFVSEINDEFNAVLPFIYQSEGYKPIELGIEDIYGAEKPRLIINYSKISKEAVMKRRAEVLKEKKEETSQGNKSIGSYTYEELRHMLGSDDLDVIITRDSSGVKLSIGKTRKEK